jgi:hypothetical protein
MDVEQTGDILIALTHLHVREFIDGMEVKYRHCTEAWGTCPRKQGCFLNHRPNIWDGYLYWPTGLAQFSFVLKKGKEESLTRIRGVLAEGIEKDPPGCT